MASSPAGETRLTRAELDTIARREARRAIDGAVAASGGRTLAHLRTSGRTWPGASTIEPEPIAQIESAHAIEQAARDLISEFIRLARQAGRNWYEIGNALDLHYHAVAAKISIAEVAHDYALDNQTSTGIHTFTWTCPACGRRITDQGPFRELPTQEEGHAGDCPRWTAELAEWSRYQRGPVA